MGTSTHLYYGIQVITGCIRGATNNTNNSNKTNVANKPNLNVSSDMEIENRFARVTEIFVN